MKKMYFALLALACVTMLTACEKKNPNGGSEEAKLEAVDLGLSVKWANMNVGAKSISEAGDYFAWGETAPKDNYADTNCKYMVNAGSFAQLTKYCTKSSFGKDGFVDDKTVLEPEDDAATQNLGTEWRTPTRAEVDELRNKCHWEKANINGVDGFKVSADNGNWIFLPVTGYMMYSNLGMPSMGQYLLAEIDANTPSACYYMYFNIKSDSKANYTQQNREFGKAVRGVCK
jgi:hypothetical protein